MRVDTPAHMAEGSRNVGEPGYAETFFKDTTKPDGDWWPTMATLPQPGWPFLYILYMAFFKKLVYKIME
jgi:hypothetical protein